MISRRPGGRPSTSPVTGAEGNQLAPGRLTLVLRWYLRHRQG